MKRVSNKYSKIRSKRLKGLSKIKSKNLKGLLHKGTLSLKKISLLIGGVVAVTATTATSAIILTNHASSHVSSKLATSTSGLNIPEVGNIYYQNVPEDKTSHHTAADNTFIQDSNGTTNNEVPKTKNNEVPKTNEIIDYQEQSSEDIPNNEVLQTKEIIGYEEHKNERQDDEEVKKIMAKKYDAMKAKYKQWKPIEEKKTSFYTPSALDEYKHERDGRVDFFIFDNNAFKIYISKSFILLNANEQNAKARATFLANRIIDNLNIGPEVSSDLDGIFILDRVKKNTGGNLGVFGGYSQGTQNHVTITTNTITYKGNESRTFDAAVATTVHEYGHYADWFVNEHFKNSDRFSRVLKFLKDARLDKLFDAVVAKNNAGNEQYYSDNWNLPSDYSSEWFRSPRFTDEEILARYSKSSNTVRWLDKIFTLGIHDPVDDTEHRKSWDLDNSYYFSPEEIIARLTNIFTTTISPETIKNGGQFGSDTFNAYPFFEMMTNDTNHSLFFHNGKGGAGLHVLRALINDINYKNHVNMVVNKGAVHLTGFGEVVNMMNKIVLISNKTNEIVSKKDLTPYKSTAIYGGKEELFGLEHANKLAYDMFPNDTKIEFGKGFDLNQNHIAFMDSQNMVWKLNSNIFDKYTKNNINDSQLNNYDVNGTDVNNNNFWSSKQPALRNVSVLSNDDGYFFKNGREYVSTIGAEKYHVEASWTENNMRNEFLRIPANYWDDHESYVFDYQVQKAQEGNENTISTELSLHWQVGQLLQRKWHTLIIHRDGRIETINRDALNKTYSNSDYESQIDHAWSFNWRGEQTCMGFQTNGNSFPVRFHQDNNATLAIFNTNDTKFIDQRAAYISIDENAAKKGEVILSSHAWEHQVVGEEDGVNLTMRFRTGLKLKDPIMTNVAELGNDDGWDQNGEHYYSNTKKELYSFTAGWTQNVSIQKFLTIPKYAWLNSNVDSFDYKFKYYAEHEWASSKDNTTAKMASLTTKLDHLNNEITIRIFKNGTIKVLEDEKHLFSNDVKKYYYLDGFAPIGWGNGWKKDYRSVLEFKTPAFKMQSGITIDLKRLQAGEIVLGLYSNDQQASGWEDGYNSVIKSLSIQPHLKN